MPTRCCTFLCRLSGNHRPTQNGTPQIQPGHLYRLRWQIWWNEYRDGELLINREAWWHTLFLARGGVTSPVEFGLKTKWALTAIATYRWCWTEHCHPSINNHHIPLSSGMRAQVIGNTSSQPSFIEVKCTETTPGQKVSCQDMKWSNLSMFSFGAIGYGSSCSWNLASSCLTFGLVLLCKIEQSTCRCTV